MTDMRDLPPANESRAENAFIDTGASEIEIKESYTLDDSGGLGEFHHAAEEESNRGPILGALAIALMIGAAGAAVYTMYGPQAEVVADESLPRTSAPQAAAVTPMTPPAADSAAGDGMAMAPTDTEMSTPASTPTRAQTAMSPPAAPDMAPRPAQQRVANAPARVAAPPAAVTPAPEVAAPSPATIAPPAVMPPAQTAAVPEPVSPTPPASAIAGNPPLNEQSAPVEEVAPVTPTVPEPAPAEPAAPLDQSQ